MSKRIAATSVRGRALAGLASFIAACSGGSVSGTRRRHRHRQDEARLYRALYAALKRPSVRSVTTWGLHDGHSWYNEPPSTRVNFPLLFDASGNPKWAFRAVVDSTIAIP